MVTRKLLIVAASLAPAWLVPPLRADVPIFPMPPAGGPRPTVNLSASSGAPGDAITVSGTLSSSQTAVNVLLLIDRNGDGQLDATRGLAVIPVSGGAYSASVVLPDDLDDESPGSLAIGVAAAGATNAEVVTRSFNLRARRTGSFSGLIPQAATGEATIAIYDKLTGALAASAPIGLDGSFAFSSVAPGDYRAVVTGIVSELFSIDGYVHVESGNSTAWVDSSPFTGPCQLLSSASISRLGASPTASTKYAWLADWLGYRTSSGDARSTCSIPTSSAPMSQMPPEMPCRSRFAQKFNG